MYSISSIKIFLDKASWNRIDSGKSSTFSDGQYPIKAEKEGL